MRVSIPCLYADYGRYIDAFRGIPSYIDSLKLSQRRSLLSLFDVTKATKKVKAAKVVGYIIGNLHPHGDLSAYQTLKVLVWQNYAEGQGNWGARNLKEDDSPAAMRYTECKLKPWVRDLVFKYHKFVPWDNFELEDEPLYLPCIVPIGLIGYDNISGGGFHRTLIPKYSLESLLIRLKWLIENWENIPIFEEGLDQYSEEKYGPQITPNFRDCVAKENLPGEFYKLLYKGQGDIRAIPNGTIQNGKLYVLGKAPTFKTTAIERDIDDKKIDIKIFKELSADKNNPYYICGEFTPKNKKVDLKELYKTIWTKYFIKNFKYTCYFVKNEIPEVMGIDNVLVNNYINYVNAIEKYRVMVCEKLIKKHFNTSLLLIIRDIITNYNCNKIDDIIAVFRSNKTSVIQTEYYKDSIWKSMNITVNEDMIIEICNTKSIKQLVEVKNDIPIIVNDINNAKIAITNIQNDCYQEVCTMITNPIKM